MNRRHRRLWEDLIGFIGELNKNREGLEENKEPERAVEEVLDRWYGRYDTIFISEADHTKLKNPTSSAWRCSALGEGTNCACGKDAIHDCGHALPSGELLCLCDEHYKTLLEDGEVPVGRSYVVWSKEDCP